MEITRGRQRKGVKLVLDGPEGIGKSTFVSKIPGVVFIDTEGSTGEMDVLRMPKPTSWPMLLQEVDYAIDHPNEIAALAIDTGDWAERLCIDYVCETRQVNGKPAESIEAYGYGRGYVYLYEEFGKLLNKLQIMSDQGRHVAITAHAAMRKFEQPDELGTYDRWELKMTKKVAPLVKEWASLMIFANYKTFVYAADDKGQKHKASGGKRVMYTTHHPCWDAKSRYDLPEEMEFDFSKIAHLFTPQVEVVQEGKPVEKSIEQKVDDRPKLQQTIDEVLGELPEFKPVETKAAVDTMARIPEDKPKIDYKGVPAALQDLMKQYDITPFEVQAAVASRGYFPLNTPFENYPADFIQGVLIGAWDQVKALVLKNREEKPF